jgi:hypothetical protein
VGVEDRENRFTAIRLATLSLLVALLVASLGATVALADGDPASDYLIGQQVFLSYDAKVPKAAQQKLLAAVRSANAQEFRVRVALIWSSYDLGSVPELFRKPHYYARFLDTEDSYWFKRTTHLVVVMPNGLGYAQWKHDPAAGYQTIAGIKFAPTPSGMAAAAASAVVKLAGAAGVKVSTNGGSAVATSTDDAAGSSARTEIIAAVLAALVLGVAARVLVKRRAERSALR